MRKLRHGQQQSSTKQTKSRRAAGCLVAVAIVVAFTAQAIAAIPRSGGCWGTCGGDGGPVGGYFVVGDHQVQSFLIDEKCLGTGKYGLPNEIADVPSMPVSRNGKFQFKGEARRTASSGESPVHVTLTGTFLTPTKASITLMITYARCGTTHLTIVRHD